MELIGDLNMESCIVMVSLKNCYHSSTFVPPPLLKITKSSPEIKSIINLRENRLYKKGKVDCFSYWFLL